MVGPAENYAYLNALVRSRLSLFFRWEELVSLARGNLAGLEGAILSGRYGESYRYQLVTAEPSALKRIETALAYESTRQLSWLLAHASGEPKALLSVLLARADLYNFRLLLRSFAVSGGHMKEPLWHLYGSLPRSFYKSLFDCSSPMEAVERALSFNHPFVAPIAEALRQLEVDRNLLAAEGIFLVRFLEIQREIAMKFPTKNGRLVLEFLGRLVDLWNLGLWIRKRSGYDRGSTGMEYLTGGAWIDPRRLEEAEVVGVAVSGTPWQSITRRISAPSHHEFYRALNVEFWRWQVKQLRKDPLGIEVAMGFSAWQIVEWQNLTALAIGLSLGLRPEQITQSLIPLE